jgi:hypothetical protein
MRCAERGVVGSAADQSSAFGPCELTNPGYACEWGLDDLG